MPKIGGDDPQPRVPPVCALLVTGTRADAFLAGMASLMLVYVLRASRVVHADYWNAVDARAALERRASSLEVLSSTDALTQLHNRPHFDQRLAAEWARSQRSGDALALLMIDLDHFKGVNDRHGHAVGDTCLRATAVALQGALHRPSDSLARYGGEEFAALLPVITGKGAAIVAERMRHAVNSVVIQHEGHVIPLSCSIGCHTVTRFAGVDIAEAMGCADKAMYEAKQRGRNRVVSANE